MDKIKITLIFALIIGLIGGGLYWLSIDAKKSKEEKTLFMNNGYKYSKGIITQIHHYKGQTIRIKYRVDRVEYLFEGNWDNNSKNLGVGDSVAFRYATHNPKIIVTELENDY